MAVFVNIGLGIPFAMMYGALGMAAVAAISELVKSLVVFVLLRMEFGIRYPWRGTFRFLLVGGAVGAGLWWLQGYVPLLVAGGIGLIGWLIAVRYCGVLTGDEIRLLVTLVPERFQPVLTTLTGT